MRDREQHTMLKNDRKDKVKTNMLVSMEWGKKRDREQRMNLMLAC